MTYWEEASFFIESRIGSNDDEIGISRMDAFVFGLSIIRQVELRDYVFVFLTLATV